MFWIFLIAVIPQVTPENNTDTTPRNGVRDNRLLFDDLFWFANGGSSSSDDDDKPGLASCHCQCGVSNQEQRIVGGIPTGINRYPWVARLLYNGQFHCGGSLLNQDYVLTAAHCVRNLKRTKIRVILGDYDMTSTSDAPAKMRMVSSIVRHRNFDVNSYNHDIALLRLRKPVNYTKNIRPVCLPSTEMDLSGKTGTVVGWGRTSEGGALAPVQQQVSVPILSLSECRSLKYRPSRITSNMVCAGKGMGDSCQGDSGGPLLVDTGGDKYTIAGIVSWGVGCGREGYPGVYTRVSRYYEWITNSMRDTCLCNS
ncbi:trypsin-1-like [Macrosteles quadrilineatus]|uniref:trypsin-1-like n=1 Tax=Macrosteles quadrilineatus TaxID=74068 RepID=UPI0023E1A5AB|nr:trypsin-1-like [Macrosteles quadrilineatus]